MKRLLTIIPLILIAGLLSHCGGNQSSPSYTAATPFYNPLPTQQTPPKAPFTQEEIDFYGIDPAPKPQVPNVTTRPQVTLSEMDTAQALIDKHAWQLAYQVLSKIDSTHLSHAQLTQYNERLTLALLRLDQPKLALETLKPLLPLQANSLMKPIAAEIYYRTDYPLNSTLQQASSGNVLDIWHTLSLSRLANVEHTFSYTHDPLPRGYLSLNIITRANANDTAHMNERIRVWQNTYPDHPASQLLPESLSEEKLVLNRIAVFLPLSGDYASLGKAIQQGMLYRYYKEKPSYSLNFYDTATNSVNTLYHQAVEAHTDLIIGPMTPKHVSDINSLRPALPVITLNYTEHRPSTNVVEFGLSPLQQATQLAEFAWRKGHTKALIITSNTARGQRISKSLSKKWQQLGGTISDNLFYQTDQDLNEQIKALMQITASDKRRWEVQGDLNIKLQFTPIRRHDFDVIFLAANPSTARQLKPLLKFNYAEDIPVYAMNDIYSGISNTRTDHDLDGTVFCDMPWVITPTKGMNLDKAQLNKQFNERYQSTMRLYATGIDTLLIAEHYQRFHDYRYFPVNGNSGAMTLSNDNKIEVQQPCAMFRNGVAKELR